MDDRYFVPVPGGLWSTGAKVGDRCIPLIQDRSLLHPDDAEHVLRALNIPLTQQNLDLYFPHRADMGRCPTLDLLELTCLLDPTNPKTKKAKGEVGV